MKKTVCLVTNWYPTEDNPFKGVFFKEQAFAVSDDFDFIVVHIRDHKKKNIFSKPSLISRNVENNTIEYTFDFPVPISVAIADEFCDFKMKHIKYASNPGIGRYISNKHVKYYKKQLVKLFSENIKENIDAFYCVDAQLEAYIIQYLAEAFNKPYVVAEHAPVPWPGNVICDINKYAIEKSNLFIAISNDKIRQVLLQNIKLPEIVYLGNLIDETKLLCKQNNNEVKTFIIVAAHSFYKNYDMFISVMNRLCEIAKQDFKVMIVGYGSNKGYSTGVEQFEAKIKSSKFADKAIMIPSVPHDQIGETLNKADAFIMTSIQEGQPVSAMEAACCGLPIFSTRCGGVEDYVDAKMGRIYDVIDSEGMANGLNDYLEGRITFDSEYIRSNVVSKFGREAFARNFVDAFNKVIERNE
ncbi:Glycosyltransferase involved in cell wall bisynthesis [Ruminococcaceae bacterium YAD3003]|nr:Glycosyltransferase involved in cell wall bisynthesis [Ruminococcaceae bacterium YAD3003]